MMNNFGNTGGILMKKLLMILFIYLLIFLFSACSAGDRSQNAESTPRPNPEPIAYKGNTPTYKDGTYTAQGEKWQYGYENATVVIKNGQITQVILRRFDRQGKEIDYNEWTGQEVNEVTGKLKTNLKQARTYLANRIVDSQSYDVDNVTGATISSINWKLSVQRALEQATK
ncbi:MAG: hypothetical protein PWQ70_659 [Clostridiales bacterium]|nr:hypothetical protein [Clostridiales bacterium]